MCSSLEAFPLIIEIGVVFLLDVVVLLDALLALSAICCTFGCFVGVSISMLMSVVSCNVKGSRCPQKKSRIHDFFKIYCIDVVLFRKAKLIFHHILFFRSIGGTFITGVGRERKFVEEVDEDQISTAASKSAGERSTGPVDRPQQQQIGRPDRSTDVHNMHKVVAVDRSGRPQKESGQPPGRPIESA